MTAISPTSTGLVPGAVGSVSPAVPAPIDLAARSRACIFRGLCRHDATDAIFPAFPVRVPDRLELSIPSCFYDDTGLHSHPKLTNLATMAALAALPSLNLASRRVAGTCVVSIGAWSWQGQVRDWSVMYRVLHLCWNEQPQQGCSLLDQPWQFFLNQPDLVVGQAVQATDQTVNPHAGGFDPAGQYGLFPGASSPRPPGRSSPVIFVHQFSHFDCPSRGRLWDGCRLDVLL